MSLSADYHIFVGRSSACLHCLKWDFCLCPSWLSSLHWPLLFGKAILFHSFGRRRRKSRGCVDHRRREGIRPGSLRLQPIQQNNNRKIDSLARLFTSLRSAPLLLFSLLLILALLTSTLCPTIPT